VTNYDVTIIGGGIVGMATAMALAKKKNIKICVLEAEEKLAAHQTGNNSGVIHSGLYYKPGSLKARNCVEGRQKLYEFCRKHNIAHEQCGKVVVATRTEEIPALDELERKGHANGLIGLKRLSRAQINKYEPHIIGIGGLLVPETGIVDYVQVTNKFAELVMSAGNEIKLKTAFTGLKESNNGLIIETTKGEIQSKNIVNCAGLQSDRIARACGMEPGLRIIPFRGEYYELKPDKHHLINNLVYPVPDPAFPFLGVHFTRMIHGGVEAGPNAVLAFKREGYKKTSFSIKDSSEIFGYRGFLLLAAKFMKMGMGEFYRSFSKAAFVKALQRLLPEIESKDIVPGGAGVRAQALEKNGNLVDDFRIVQNDRMIHVLNAPSPAATASISIGEKIAIMAEEQFALI
jgi:L-2-hydroxyglutarate oxidase